MAKMAKTWPLGICLMLIIVMMTTCAWCQESTTTPSPPSKPLWIHPEPCRTYLRPEPDCRAEISFRYVEQNIVKLLALGPDGRPFPETQQQLITYCGESRDLLSKIQSAQRMCFVQKVDNFTETVFAPLKNITDLVCYLSRHADNEDTKSMLDMGKCFNGAWRRQDPCSQQYAEKTKQLFHYHRDDKKHAFMCCNLHKMIKCTDTAIYAFPCFDSTKNFTTDFLNNWPAAMMNAFCWFDDDGIKSCNANEMPVPLIPNPFVYKSPIFATLDLYDSTKDFQESQPTGNLFPAPYY